MKTISLDRSAFDRLVSDHNVKRQDQDKKAWKKSATDNVFLFIAVVATCNYYKHKSGYATRSKKKSMNNNPYLLCNGKLIYEIEYTDMPILLSEAAHNILITKEGRAKAEALGLIERYPLPWSPDYQNQFFYQLTALGKRLLPDTVTHRKLGRKDTLKVRKYLLAQNGLTKNKYKHLIKGILNYKFKIPSQEDFVRDNLYRYTDNGAESVKSEPSNEEDNTLTPTEKLIRMHRQMATFNILDEESLLFHCCSDEPSWAGRFYATPVFVKSFCRQYLINRKSKNQLIELDIQNSQFQMLNAVLKQYFPKVYDRQFDADLQSETCLYVTIARAVFNDPNITKDDPRRNQVKGTMFKSFFKGSFRTTSSDDNLETRINETVRERYPQLIPCIDKLKMKVNRQFNTRAMPYYFGRYKKISHKYHEIMDRNKYRKVSFSTTLKETQIMSELWEALYKMGISIVPVHDAILIDPVDLHRAKPEFERILLEQLGYNPVLNETDLKDKQRKDKEKAKCIAQSTGTSSYSLNETEGDRKVITTSATASDGAKRGYSGQYLHQNTVILKKTGSLIVGECNQHQCFQWFFATANHTSTLRKLNRQSRVGFRRRKSFIFTL